MKTRALGVLFLMAMEPAVLPASPVGMAFTPAPDPTPSPATARCGDYRCDAPEDCNTCPQDCGRCCGNHRCEPPEDCNTCAQDCGRCR